MNIETPACSVCCSPGRRARRLPRRGPTAARGRCCCRSPTSTGCRSSCRRHRRPVRRSARSPCATSPRTRPARRATCMSIELRSLRDPLHAPRHRHPGPAAARRRRSSASSRSTARRRSTTCRSCWPTSCSTRRSRDLADSASTRRPAARSSSSMSPCASSAGRCRATTSLSDPATFTIEVGP